MDKVNSDYATVQDIDTALSRAMAYTNASGSIKLDRTEFDEYTRESSDRDASVDARLSFLENQIAEFSAEAKKEIVHMLISEIAGKFKYFISSNDIEAMSDEEFNNELEKLLYD